MESTSRLFNLISLFGLGPDTLKMLGLAFLIPLGALLITVLIGLPLGGAIAVKRFPTKEKLLDWLACFTGWKSVLLAILAYLAILQLGPIDTYQLVYHPVIIIVVQAVFITPVIIFLSQEIIAAEWKQSRKQFLRWRMRGQQALPTLFWRTRSALLAVCLAGFGRATKEIGAVMILGALINYLLAPQAVDPNLQVFQQTVMIGAVMSLIALMVLVLTRCVGGVRGNS